MGWDDYAKHLNDSSTFKTSWKIYHGNRSMGGIRISFKYGRHSKG